MQDDSAAEPSAARDLRAYRLSLIRSSLSPVELVNPIVRQRGRSAIKSDYDG